MSFKVTHRLFPATLVVVSLFIFISIAVFSVNYVSAQDVDVDDDSGKKATEEVGDAVEETTEEVDETADEALDYKKNAKKLYDTLSSSFKNVLGTFLNQLAGESAVWIASGGKGQAPLFITDGWKAYLTNAADRALGEFVQDVGQGLNELYQESVKTYEQKEIIIAAGGPEGYDDYINNVETNRQACDLPVFTDAQERADCYNNADRTALENAILGNNDEVNFAYQDCKGLLESDIANNGLTIEEIDGQCRSTVTEPLTGGFSGFDVPALNGLGSVVNAFTGDLCSPSSLEVSLNISLTLGEQQRTQRPTCTFSQIRDNLEATIDSADFTITFNNYWNPNENDLGIMLTLLDRKVQAQAREYTEKSLERLTNQGINDIKQGVGGNVGTPATLVSGYVKSTFSELGVKEKQFTGTIADAVGTFVSSLVGTYLNRLAQGLVDDDSSSNESFRSGNRFEALRSSTAGPVSTGVAGAKVRFQALREVDFSGGGAFEIINSLTICNDINNPGPTECVLTNNFRDAVTEGITVRQAIESGNLDPDLPLGFIGEGLQPTYNQGYPYRSLVILRKHRIIPVGWELAALYIKNFGEETTTLGTIVESFDDQDSPFYKLIDPNWVLKSPENFCSLEGPGPIIRSESVSKGRDANGDGSFDDEGDKRPSINVARVDNYCADERSCLQTNEDGSCKFFGYCTQDRPIFDFQGDKCEPVFNSCETFRNVQGATVSYLTNTLDFSSCSADNAGCRWYCTDQNPNDSSWSCTENSGRRIHLDSDAITCPEDAAGCRRYLDTEVGNGQNFINNSSFEQYDGAIDDTAVDYFYEGGISSSVNIGKARSDAFVGETSVLLQPTDAIQYQIDSGRAVTGRTFIFSAYVKGSCSGTTLQLDVLNPGASDPIDLDNTPSWERYSVVYTYLGGPLGFEPYVTARIENLGSDCLVDAVMLEESETLSPYQEYGAGPEVLLKTPPDYFACNTSNPSRPVECDNYTLTCTQIELGCSLYKPRGRGSAIPAVAQDSDFCPAECVGYSTFKQEVTFFEPNKFPTYFIPQSGRQCNAQAAGCDEFTNLDKLEEGAENKEYYQYLRQCVKPANASSCEPFFSWIGTNETGYQLLSEVLEGSAGAPATYASPIIVAELDLGDCATADDAINNPECRQYFNSNGVPSYQYHRLTTLCTDSCVQLRKSDSNQVDCEAAGGTWEDNSLDVTPIAHCVLNAVLDQSQICSPQFAGCRSYEGNAANNIQNVFSDNFEDGDTQGWDLGYISTDSVTAGGHSIYSGGIGGTPEDISLDEDLFSNGVIEDQGVYEISFWAHGLDTSSRIFIDACMMGGGSSACAKDNLGGFVFDASLVNSVLIGSRWNKYTLGPFTYDETLALGAGNVDDLRIIFSGRGGGLDSSEPVYMDNVEITKVRDNVYVIKDSWDTPLSCNNLLDDPYGSSCSPNDASMPPPAGECNGTETYPCVCSGPGVSGLYTSQTPFHLGCEEYQTDGETVTLKSFSYLCSEDAIGCEALIDTQNSSSPYSSGHNVICDYSNGNPQGLDQECQLLIDSSVPNKFVPVCTPLSGETSCVFSLDNIGGYNAADYSSDGSSIIVNADAYRNIVNDSKMSCVNNEVGCRALGNPNIATKILPSVRITQNGEVSYAQSFSDTENLVDLYIAPGQFNTLGGVNIASQDEMTMSVYKDETTGKSSLLFRFDDDVGGSAGSLGFTIINLSGTASTTHINDATDTLTTDTSGGGSAQWNWGVSDSDGGILEFDPNQPWSFDIDVTDYSGPHIWSFVSASGGRTALNPVVSADIIDNITIEYNPTGFSVDGFTFTTDYIIDNVDSYDRILCTEETLWCEAYTTAEGAQYFKDPRSDVCEWRQGQTAFQGEFKWFKRKVNTSDADVLCPTTDEKTVGVRGVSIDTPIGECNNGRACRDSSECGTGICSFFAGACSLSDSSCREYIDPVSEFANNIVFNGDFNQDVDGNFLPDGWDESANTGLLEYTNGIVRAVADESSGQSFSIFPIVLEPNTLYTISGKILRGDNGATIENRPALISLSECEAIANGAINTSINDMTTPDDSVSITSDTTCTDALDNPGDKVELLIAADSLNTSEYRTFTGRFKSGGDTTYSLKLGALGPASIGHWFDDLRIVETGVYYNLASTLDKTSCNGEVNVDEGCVLFNERVIESDGTVLSSRSYDADASTDTGILSTICENNPFSTLCDSNTILNVRPDRECAEWLSCNTTVINSKGSRGVSDQCLDLDLCQSIDPNTGECNRTVTRVATPQNVTLNTAKYPVALASYLSGYSKAGARYLDDGSVQGIVEGYLPFDQMTQIGGTVEMENGNFELFSNAGQPIGWKPFIATTSENGLWSKEKFAVIADPVTSQNEIGVLNSRAPEGRSYLRVGSTFNATSDFIEVASENDYLITAWMHTLNLDASAAEIRLSEYDSQGTCLNCPPGGAQFTNTSVAAELPYLESGKDWERVAAVYTVGPLTTRIRLQLRALGTTVVGSFYFDDVSITPVLNVQNSLVGANTISHEYCETRIDDSEHCYIAQSCRLFPEDDSLSCDYIDDAGLITRGLFGYCLEHDPANREVCIDWWPVDQIQGRGFDELNLGYSERLPLFMCLHSEDAGFIGTWSPLKDPLASGFDFWDGNLDLTKDYSFTCVCTGGGNRCDNSGWQPNNISYYFEPDRGIQGTSIWEPYEPLASAIQDEIRILNVDFVPLLTRNNGVHYGAGGNITGTKLSGHYCLEPGTGDVTDFDATTACDSQSDCSGDEICTGIWESGSWGSNMGCLMAYDFSKDEFWVETWGSDGSGSCSNPFNACGVEIDIDFRESICTEIAQVVSSSGLNTAWTGRIDRGSSYVVPGGVVLPDEINTSVNADYIPFGGIVAPEPIDFPEEWDARVSKCVDTTTFGGPVSNGVECKNNSECFLPFYDTCGFLGKDPLKVEVPDVDNFDEPYQARSGTPYSCDTGTSCSIGRCFGTNDACTLNSECNFNLCCNALSSDPRCLDILAHEYPISYANSITPTDGQQRVQRIFAKSYGTWSWNDTAKSYDSNGGLEWLAPTEQCPAGAAIKTNIRPAYNPLSPQSELCGVAPVISNAQISSPANGQVDNTGFVTLSFNSNADFNQLPFKRIKVDWGDGKTSVISGVKIQDRPSITEPHQFFHLYSYWELKGKSSNSPSIDCSNPQACQVTIRVQVQDNWGWCNATPVGGGSILGLYKNKCDTENNYLPSPDDTAWTELVQKLTVTE